MSNRKYAIGAAVGAIAGLVAGVLTAPKSGKETREDLKVKAVELKEETERRIEAARDAKKPIDSLKDQAEHAISRGKEVVKGISDKK